MKQKEFDEFIEDIEDIDELDFALIDADAHCCRDYEVNGVCKYCGNVIPGSMLYLEIYGGE